MNESFIEQIVTQLQPAGGFIPHTDLRKLLIAAVKVGAQNSERVLTDPPDHDLIRARNAVASLANDCGEYSFANSILAGYGDDCAQVRYVLRAISLLRKEYENDR